MPSVATPLMQITWAAFSEDPAEPIRPEMVCYPVCHCSHFLLLPCILCHALAFSLFLKHQSQSLLGFLPLRFPVPGIALSGWSHIFPPSDFASTLPFFLGDGVGECHSHARIHVTYPLSSSQHIIFPSHSFLCLQCKWPPLKDKWHFLAWSCLVRMLLCEFFFFNPQKDIYRSGQWLR